MDLYTRRTKDREYRIVEEHGGYRVIVKNRISGEIKEGLVKWAGAPTAKVDLRLIPKCLDLAEKLSRALER